MTLRGDILEAIAELLRGREDQSFTSPEVVGVLKRRGSPYKELSIRSQITHRMSATAPDAARGRSHELERVARGRFRLR